MAKRKAKKLTQQQEIFAQFVAAGKQKTEAHKLASYKSKTQKNRSNEASRLSRVPHIAARIEELKAATAEEFSYTRKEAFDELVEVQGLARNSANTAVMSKVVGQKIDLAGIEPPKKNDVNVTGGIRLTLPGEMTREEWEAEE